ncbi:piggyBac transposable element-derived protein 3-like [Vespula maculifrons]|uniref:PiggyBac transposable element-derived protein 3-like n=1 Tax=Vespula maculifrons TaxID=7453 RepID=A0ABD2ASL9_VESMC
MISDNFFTSLSLAIKLITKLVDTIRQNKNYLNLQNQKRIICLASRQFFTKQIITKLDKKVLLLSSKCKSAKIKEDGKLLLEIIS